MTITDNICTSSVALRERTDVREDGAQENSVLQPKLAGTAVRGPMTCACLLWWISS